LDFIPRSTVASRKRLGTLQQAHECNPCQVGGMRGRNVATHDKLVRADSTLN
jgi:hypothetical protein